MTPDVIVTVIKVAAVAGTLAGGWQRNLARGHGTRHLACRYPITSFDAMPNLPARNTTQAQATSA